MSMDWPDLPSYLLLDPARHDDLLKWIYDQDSNPIYTPLYAQTPMAELVHLSPVLVKAPPTSQLWLQYHLQGVSQQWGIILFSKKPLAQLVKHCQWWLKAKPPTHNEGLFYFYNPEVCWRVLRASVPEQQAYLMGPIQQVSCFDEQWHHFTQAQPRVQPSHYDQLLKLSANQWDALDKVKKYAFLKKLHAHIESFFPHLLAEKPYEQQMRWTEELAKKARELKFDGTQDIFYFANVVGFLGAYAMNPKLYPEIHQLLTQASPLTPSQRIEKAAFLAQKAAANRSHDV